MLLSLHPHTKYILLFGAVHTTTEYTRYKKQNYHNVSIIVMALAYPRQVNFELHRSWSGKVKAHRAVGEVGPHPLLALRDKTLKPHLTAWNQ